VNNLDPLTQFLHGARIFLRLTFIHSRHSTDAVPEFHAEAPQATVSEGLAQGPYVAWYKGITWPGTLHYITQKIINKLKFQCLCVHVCIFCQYIHMSVCVFTIGHI